MNEILIPRWYCANVCILVLSKNIVLITEQGREKTRKVFLNQ